MRNMEVCIFKDCSQVKCISRCGISEKLEGMQDNIYGSCEFNLVAAMERPLIQWFLTLSYSCLEESEN